MKLSEVSSLIEKNNCFLIVTHRNPDGDTLGSAAALCSALRRSGKKAALYANPQITEKYRPYVERFLDDGSFCPRFVICVDVASETQFPESFAVKVDLCIDHHPSNTGYAANTVLDGRRAACGEIVLKVIKNLCGDPTPEEATLLYMALTTDTGAFQYSNTDAAAFAAASELMKAGADHTAIVESFFRKVSRARIALEGMIFSDIRFFRNGKIAAVIVTKDMLNHCGAVENDLDDLAGLAGRVEGAVLGITVREMDSGSSKVSLRSNELVNSSEVCAVFGGGGHAKAAGCVIENEPEQALSMLLAVIDEVWK